MGEREGEGERSIERDRVGERVGESERERERESVGEKEIAGGEKAG